MKLSTSLQKRWVVQLISMMLGECYFMSGRLQINIMFPRFSAWMVVRCDSRKPLTNFMFISGSQSQSRPVIFGDRIMEATPGVAH